jgi:hypothetical protein
MRRSSASMTSLTSKPHSSSLSPGSVQRTEKITTRAKNHAARIKVRVRCVRNQGSGGANKKFHLFHYGDDSHPYRISLIRSQRKGKKVRVGNGSSRSAINSQTHVVRACGYFSELKFIDSQAPTRFHGEVEIEQKIQLRHRCRISSVQQNAIC